MSGNTGLVGSSILGALFDNGFSEIITRTHKQLDLADRSQVEQFFASEKPEYVFLAGARVGGILTNKTFGGDFIRENLYIQTNAIDISYRAGVKKFIFIGSNCAYPRLSPNPLKEEYLLTGELEPTNMPFAVAKIAGIKMCQSYNSQYGLNYKSIMPTNLYGPGDNYDLNNSHVIPAIIRKTHEAIINKEDSITLWGSGNARRDILHVDDLAEASLCVLENIKKCDDIINVGSGTDYSIKDLAKIVKKCLQYDGEYIFDHSMPDGTPRKLLDNKKISALGWSPKINLLEGIKNVYFDKFKR